MDDCLFCKIIKGDIPATKVYEDKQCLAFLDINPINKGHTLVIPKQHCKDIYDVPEETLKSVSIAAKKVSIAVKKAMGCDGVNIGMNNGASAGQVIFHMHFHVMPRFENDGHEHWKGTPYSDDATREDVGTKIRELL